MNDLNVVDWMERDEGGKVADAMSRFSPGPESIFEPRTKYDLVPAGKYTPPDILMSMRLTFAAYTLRHLIEIDPDRMGGAPVLVGTRFTIARIVAELADGMTVTKLAREFDLNKEHIVEVLHGIAITLDRPFSR